ncbi:septum site-determining protein MinC [Oceanobacter mangrovi]|uniref:septum site-determining protein MinC n=1 Tax=Oceanobacter mangrovi TaxID=2862510 RepID=UPI001C8DBCF4|nr:septum site-determining protein MinC [Oceanobacter mangrovi]
MKTGMVPLTTIQLHSTDLNALQDELSRRKAEAPALFAGLPCLLSLADLPTDVAGLQQLVSLLRQHGLALIGVRSCPAELATELASLQLADFGQASRPPRSKPAEETPDKSTTDESGCRRAVKVHEGNVRSGQQLYFDGDLYIIGMVSPGAEVLATGDIHVLGVLRGKALAGIKGSPDAIVSCVHFDAQLVAIAGHYQLFENGHALTNQSVLVRLDDDQLVIKGAEK